MGDSDGSAAMGGSDGSAAAPIKLAAVRVFGAINSGRG
jgi:hypothetical protein